MSKNFELLRQADWRQEYFEGLPSTPSPEHSTHHPSSRRKRFRVRNDQISNLVRRVFLDPRSLQVRTVMFCGATRKTGCTWTCVNTAKALSDSVAGTVCVIDANFLAPSLHNYFSATSSSGISDAIFESTPSKQFATQCEDTNLWVLPAGKQCRRLMTLPDKSLLESHLRELRGEFDYLLVDAPALSSGSLAVSIGRVGDGTVLVLESSGIAPNVLLQARKHLDRAQVQLFGVVLNQREPTLPPVLDRLIK
jgi:Mrp family chromosome partitioning ATPase